MCGLAGLAQLDGRPLPVEADLTLNRMARAVAHRGPDDTVIRRDGPVGLAFTRLSLVDPEGGGQPLVSGDGQTVLIANGEIYNHRALRAGLPAGTRFHTDSDCEVLLHLYQQRGLDFLDAVRGMFSLVLVDRHRGVLILARDRFAIKPLYYARLADRIVFGSELKALFQDPQCPRRLDWPRALADPGLNLAPVLTDAAPTTWFEGIEQVPAATIVQIDLRTGATRSHRYWSLAVGGDEAAAPTDAEYVDRYRELLTEAVTDCLMADVEIGLFLSGGIDSGAVAALAARASNLHTFTVLSASTTLDGDGQHAHQLAATLGLPNHQVLFEADRVPGPVEWKRLLWLLETPQCGPEQYYKFELHRYARAERPTLRAMLLGAAADEFTGGYTELMSGGEGWDGFLSAVRVMARNRDLQRHPGLAPWWSEGEHPVLTDEALHPERADEDLYGSFLRWKFRDVQQHNLWHEDRTAAGNGIEARVPFLDHRLVELVAGIPPARRPRLLWDKRILREAMRGILPAEIVDRPKGPFYQGEGMHYTLRTFIRMLAQDGGALLEESIASDRARQYLDPDGLRLRLARLVADPTGDRVEILLRLVNLGLLEQMTSALPEPPVATRFDRVPVALSIEDWAGTREKIELLTVPRPRIEPDQVVRRGAGVTLVSNVDEPTTCYVAVDGTLEYVVDGGSDPEWLGFLLAVDGRRSVAEILARTGADLDRVYPLLQEAVEYRVLALGAAVEAG
jgi:asparagine synthase (glutamine-hydrolysing)